MCWVGGADKHAGKFSQSKVACRREGARDREGSTAERFISLRDRQNIMRQESRRLFVFFFSFSWRIRTHEPASGAFAARVGGAGVPGVKVFD